MSEMNLTLVRQEFPLTIDGKKYIIREMTGAERGKWMTSINSRLKTDKDGRPAGMRSLEGLESSLICKCLYDESDTLVPQSEIEQWPATCQNTLFKKCQDMNGLGNDEDDKEKKG